MTTKWKIITGFFFMILLVGVVAGIGYVSVNNATGAFTEYRRVARLNTRYAELLINQHASAAAVRLFRISMEPGLMDESRSFIKRNQALSGEAKIFVKRKETMDILEEVHARSDEQIAAITALEKALVGVMDLYGKIQQPAIETFGAAIGEMFDMFAAGGNNAALHMSGKIMINFAAARAANSRFVFNRTLKNVDEVMLAMADVTRDVDKMASMLTSFKEREVFAKARKAHDEMIAATSSMRAAVLNAIRQNEILLKMNNEIEDHVKEISDNVKLQQDDQGERAVRINQSAQNSMISTAAAGIIIGGLLAFFIIAGLIRVLRGLSRFAGAIADGDFQAQPVSREKGEIGALLAAMRQITSVLQSILNDYRALGDRIEAGDLDAQGNPAAYKGGFATLVEGTNMILARFLMVLENIPSTVVVLNKKLYASYVNAVGRKIAGQEYKGKTCKQLMEREDFGSPADALTQAVESLRPASAETRAHPQGIDMDVSYTAIPMLDHEGKLASVLQLITDLTAIKQTQRVIHNVAQQAASISNRVAVAAEELSAQVEEVSRGAEVQRARVESTATAMA
ncbi:MAG: PAS domain-containing protein, partial [Desulfovibrionaceae bacterium]|nr:PAS domain-containing protein [Desulfovibrionaceae bacterium]